MEFCQGGELFSLLSQSNLSETKARFYASCVLEALAYLHAKHVVFRDLKVSFALAFIIQLYNVIFFKAKTK